MEAQRPSGMAGDESSLTHDERVSSLFQPDTLLSTQYFENLRRKTLFEPEKRLMLAILEDGVRCYLDNLDAGGSKKQRLFEDAEAWVVENDGDWVFSFESVCDALVLEPRICASGIAPLERKRRRSPPRPPQ